MNLLWKVWIGRVYKVSTSFADELLIQEHKCWIPSIPQPQNHESLSLPPCATVTVGLLCAVYYAPSFCLFLTKNSQFLAQVRSTEYYTGIYFLFLFFHFEKVKKSLTGIRMLSYFPSVSKYPPAALPFFLSLSFSALKNFPQREFKLLT